MGVQELLVHLHPLFAAVVLPALALVAVAALPWLSGGERPSGRWFISPRGARLAALAAVAGMLLTKVAILVDEPLRRAPPWLPQLAPAIRGGLLPTLGLAAVIASAGLLTRRRGASRQESIQAVFTLVLAAFVVLTLAGVLFRGQGMALTTPWASRPPELP
jgi:hypothetical protein